MWTKIKTFLGKFWASLAVNARDIVSTTACIVVVLFITQLITTVGMKLGIDLHDLKSFVFAVAKFAFVALCGVGYLTHVTFRDSMGECDTTELMATWKTVLTPKERLEWFLKIAMAGLIAAALVFSIGV